MKSKTLMNIQIYELRIHDFNIMFKTEEQMDPTMAEIELKQQQKLSE